MSRSGNGAHRLPEADPEGSGGSGGANGDGTEVRLAILEARVESLATKVDVTELKNQVKTLAAKEDVGEIKGYMQSLATKADIETTKADIEKAKIWFLKVALSGMAVLIGLGLGILRLFFFGQSPM